MLRLGIALLGLRVSVAMFAELGAAVIAMIVGAVLLTILFGILASRLSGQGTQFGVLTGGAVAICGASAALAISATLGNRSKEADQQMVFTVIGVTMLSTTTRRGSSWVPPFMTSRRSPVPVSPSRYRQAKRLFS